MIVIGESVRAVRVIGEGEGEVTEVTLQTRDVSSLLSPLYPDHYSWSISR